MFHDTVKYSINSKRTVPKILIAGLTVMAFIIGLVGGAVPARAESPLTDEKTIAAIQEALEESVSQSAIGVETETGEGVPRKDDGLNADGEGPGDKVAIEQGKENGPANQIKTQKIGPQADAVINDLRLVGIYLDPFPPSSNSSLTVTLSIRNSSSINEVDSDGYISVNLSQVVSADVQLGQLPIGANIIGSTLHLPLPALPPGGAGQISFSLNLGPGSTGARIKPIVSEIQLPGTVTPVPVSDANGTCLQGVLVPGSVCTTDVRVVSSELNIGDLHVSGISFNPNPPIANNSSTISVSITNTNIVAGLGPDGFITVDVSRVLGNGVALGQLPPGASLDGNLLRLPLPALGANQTGQISFPINLAQGTAGRELNPVLAGIKLPGIDVAVPVSGPNGVCLPSLLAPGSSCSATATVAPAPVGVTDIQINGISFNPNPPTAGNSATVSVNVVNTNPSIGLGANGFITVDISRVIGNGVTLGQLPPGASLNGNLLQLPLPALAASQPGQVSFPINLSQTSGNARVNPAVVGVQLPGAGTPTTVSDANGVCLPGVTAAGSTCSASVTVASPPVSLANVHIEGIRFDPNPPTAGSSISVVVDLKNISAIGRLELGGFVTINMSRVLLPGVTLGQLPPNSSIVGNILWLPLPVLNAGQSGQALFPINIGENAANGQLTPILSGIQLPGASSPTPVSDENGLCLPDIIAPGSACSASETVKDPNSVFHVDIATTATPSSPVSGSEVTYTVTATPSGLLPAGITTIWINASDIVNKANIVGGNLQLGVSIQGGSLDVSAIVGGLIPWVFVSAFDSPATLTFKATVRPGTAAGTTLTARTLVSPVDGLVVTSNCGSLLPPPIGAFPTNPGCVGTATVVTPPPVGLGDLQVTGIAFNPIPAAGHTSRVTVNVRNTNPLVALGSNGYVTVDVSRVLLPGVTLGQLPPGASIIGSTLRLPLPALAASQTGQISFSLNFDSSTSGVEINPVLAGIQLPGTNSPTSVSDVNGSCIPGILSVGSTCSVRSTIAASAPAIEIGDLQVTGIYFDPYPPLSGNLAKVTLSIRNASTIGMLKPDGFMTIDLNGVLNAGISLESFPVGASVSGNILQLPLPALAAGQVGQISFFLNLSQESAGIELKPVIDGVQLPGTGSLVMVSDAAGLCLPGVLAVGSACSTSVTVLAPEAVSLDDLLVTDMSFDPNPPVAGQSALLHVSLRNIHEHLDLRSGTVVSINVGELIGNGISLGSLPSSVTLLGDVLHWTLPTISVDETVSVELPVNFALSSAGQRIRPVLSAVQLPGDENVVVVDQGGICLSGVLASGSACSVTTTVAAPPVGANDLQISDIYFDPDPPVAGNSTAVVVSVVNTSATARLQTGGFITMDVSRLLGPSIHLGTLPSGASITGNILWLPLPSLIAGQTGRVSFSLNFDQTAVGVELRPVVVGVQLPGKGAPVEVSDAAGICLPGVLEAGSVCSADTTVAAPPAGIRDLQVVGIYFDPNPSVAGNSSRITLSIKNTHTMVELEANGFITVDVSRVLVAGVTLGQLPTGASLDGNILRLPLPALGPEQVGQVSFPLNLALSSAGAHLIPVLSGIQLPEATAPTPVSNVNGACLPGVLAAGSVCSANTMVIAPPVGHSDLQISDIIFVPSPPVAGEPSTITVNVKNTNVRVGLKADGYITVDVSKVISAGISLGTLPPGASITGNILWLPLPAIGSGQTLHISFPINLSRGTVGTSILPVLSGIQLPGVSTPVIVSNPDGTCLPGVLADGSRCSVAATVTAPVVTVNNLQIAGIFFNPTTPVAGSSASITVNVRNTNTLVGLETNGFITVDVSRVLNAGVTLGQLPPGASITGSILRLPLPTLASAQTGQVSFPINLDPNTVGLQLRPVVSGLQLPGMEVPAPVSDANGSCLPGAVAPGSVCSANATVAAPPVAVRELRIAAVSFVPNPPVANGTSTVTVDVVNTNTVVGLGVGAFITIDLNRVFATGISLGQLPPGASIVGGVLRLPLPVLAPSQSGQVSFTLNLAITSVGTELLPVVAGIQLPGAAAAVPVSDASGTCLNGVLATGSVCSATTTIVAPPVSVNDLQVSSILFNPNPPASGSPVSITINVKNTNGVVSLGANGFITVDLSKVLNLGVTLGQLPPGASVTGNILQLPLPALAPGQTAPIAFPVNLAQNTTGIQLKPIVYAVQLPGEDHPDLASDADGACLSGILAAGSVCSATTTVVVPPVSIKDIQIGGVSFNPSIPVAGGSSTITVTVKNTNPSVILKENSFITIDISGVIGSGVSLGNLPVGANIIGNILWLPLPAVGAGQSAGISFEIDLVQGTVDLELKPVIEGVQLPEMGSPIIVSDGEGLCLTGVLADDSVCSITASVAAPPANVSDLQIAGIYFDPFPPVAGNPTTITLSVRNVNTVANLAAGGFVTLDMSRVLGLNVGLGSVPPGAIVSGNTLRLPLPALETGHVGQVSFTVNLGQGTTGIRLNPVVSRIQLPEASSSVAVSSGGVCLPGILAVGSICSVNVPVVAPPISIGNLQVAGTYFDPYPPTAGSSTKVSVSIRNTSAVARLGAGGFITLDLSSVVGRDVGLGQLPIGASATGNILRLPLPSLVAGHSGQVSFFLNLGQGASGSRLKPVVSGVQLPEVDEPVPVSDATGGCIPGVLAAGSVCSVTVTVAAPPVSVSDLEMASITFAPNPPVVGRTSTIVINVRNTSTSARLETGSFVTVDVSKVIMPGVSLGTLPIGASVNGKILWLPLPTLAAGQADEVSFTLNLGQGSVNIQVNPVIAGVQLPGAIAPVPVSDVNGACLPGTLAPGSRCSATTTVVVPPVDTNDLQVSNISFSPNTPVAGSSPTVTVNVVNTSTTARLEAGGHITIDLSKVVGTGVSLGTLPPGATVNGHVLSLPLPELGAGHAGQISFSLSLSQNTAGLRLSPAIAGLQLPGTSTPVIASDVNGICLPGVFASGSICSTSATVGTSPVRVSDLQMTGIGFSTNPPAAGSSSTVTIGIRNTNLTANLNFGAFVTVEMNHVLSSGVSLGSLPLGASLHKSMLRLPMPALSAGQSGQVSFVLNIGEGTGGIEMMPVIAGVQLPGASRPVPVSNIEGACLPNVLFAGSVCSVNVTVAAPPVNISDIQISNITFTPNPPIPGTSSTVTIGIRNDNLTSSLYGAFLSVEMSRVLGTGISLGSLPAGASIDRNILRLPLPLLSAGQSGQVSFSLNIGSAATGAQLTPVVAGVQLPGAAMPVPVSNVNGVCLPEVLAHGSLCSTTTQVARSTIGLNELRVSSITFSPNIMTAGSQAVLQIALQNISTQANLSSGGFLVLDLSKVLVTNVSLRQLPAGASINGTTLRLPVPALSIGVTGQVSFTIEIGQGATGSLHPVITGVQLPGASAPVSVSSASGVCWSGVLATGSVCSTTSSPIVGSFAMKAAERRSGGLLVSSFSFPLLAATRKGNLPIEQGQEV